MKKYLVVRLVCGLIALPAQAKTVTDYRFEKYPAKVYTGKKPTQIERLDNVQNTPKTDSHR